MDGSEDYQWLLEGDIQRLADYSARSNSYWKDGRRVEGKANDLYTSNGGGIDPGFLENKMIKHAFDAYPKVRTGQYTIMETTTEEPIIDYGFVDEENSAPTPFGDENLTSEEKMLNEPKTVVVPVTEADEDDGF